MTVPTRSADMDMTDRLPSLFIPHGGGPCFFMDWSPSYPKDMWDGMGTFLKSLPDRIGRTPAAILVISGHWETEGIKVLSTPRNTLLYDYNGFPPHTYQLRYPAAGSPAIAARVVELLRAAGRDCEEEHDRGLDHGVFVPLLMVYPQADIPVLQMSLPFGAEPADLLAIGRALAPLRDEDVLIVGSGMTYHNIAGILGRLPGQAAVSAAFDAWLGDAVTDDDLQGRDARLGRWRDAPHAQACHPTPEHLLPLFVAAGAGGQDPGRRIYNAPTLGNLQSAFEFGRGAEER